MRVSADSLFFFAVAFLLQACVIKPSELKFDDSKLDRSIASATERSSYDYDVAAVMSSRAYVESVLAQAFGLPVPSTYQSSPSSGLSASLESGIYTRRDFGGACDPYAASELPTESGSAVTEFPREVCMGGIGVHQPANSNSQRYSYTIKTCETLTNNKSQFTVAMNKVFGSAWTERSQPLPDEQSITRVYQVFFKSEKPSPELVQYLIDTSTSAPTRTEAWQRIFITFCTSPEWQVL